MQTNALAELRERLLKSKTPEIYWDKSHMDCYHFCQQCKNYFKTLDTTRVNHIHFTATFLCNPISIRWAQDKCCHESATTITWSEFKYFFCKDLRSFQAFIDSLWSKFRRDSQYQLEKAQD